MIVYPLGRFAFRTNRPCTGLMVYRRPAGQSVADALGAMVRTWGGGLNSPWLRPSCGPNGVYYPLPTTDTTGRPMVIGAGDLDASPRRVSRLPDHLLGMVGG